MTSTTDTAVDDVISIAISGQDVINYGDLL